MIGCKVTQNMPQSMNALDHFKNILPCGKVVAGVVTVTVEVTDTVEVGQVSVMDVDFPDFSS